MMTLLSCGHQARGAEDRADSVPGSGGGCYVPSQEPGGQEVGGRRAGAAGGSAHTGRARGEDARPPAWRADAVGTSPPGPGEAPRLLFPWSDPPGQAPALDREDPSTRGASDGNWLPMTEDVLDHQVEKMALSARVGQLPCPASPLFAQNAHKRSASAAQVQTICRRVLSRQPISGTGGPVPRKQGRDTEGEPQHRHTLGPAFAV
uniref:Uncharacterized protein n=1 Tax=Rangifer tarandus platyrhynchus TaxID=3082113 RepID=A0ACB0FET5_RANTA|nr:unnamed protein product [Rangifer tarandus platyrhynchus]